jgi:hypothetical protein
MHTHTNTEREERTGRFITLLSALAFPALYSQTHSFIYIYVHVCVCVCVCVCIYIYIYIYAGKRGRRKRGVHHPVVGGAPLPDRHRQTRQILRIRHVGHNGVYVRICACLCVFAGVSCMRMYACAYVCVHVFLCVVNMFARVLVRSSTRAWCVHAHMHTCIHPDCVHVCFSSMAAYAHDEHDNQVHGRI